MDRLHRDTVFQALPRPTVLLDTDFVIRAANSAYLTATARAADELPLNAPVVEHNRVVALLYQVEDVTPLEEDLQRVMERYRDAMQEDPPTDADARRFADAARAFARSATDYHAMAAEVMHLRRALTSRATIDQAKGIIMAERRCTPEAAFDLLARLSQDTHVRVVDVAAALVYKAQAPRTKG
jgi:hypothetical protein